MADNYLQSLVNSSQPDKTDPSTLSTSDPLAIIKLIALQQQKQRHQQSRQMNSQDRGESSSINVDMAVIRGSAAEWPQYSLRAVRDFLRRPDAADFDDDLLDQAISSVCQVNNQIFLILFINMLMPRHLVV
jgi:hypothetical protein